MAIARGDNSNLVPGSGRVLPFWLVFNSVGQFVLPIPPKQLTIQMDKYINVNHTKFGNHLDDWGAKPIIIDMAGTFGWSTKDNENGQLSGKQSAWFFIHLDQERTRHIEDNRSDPEQFLVTFIDTKDGFIADCAISSLAFLQDTGNPHLYNYHMQLISVHVKRLFTSLATSDLPTSVTPPDVSTLNTQPLPGINPFSVNLSIGNGPTTHTVAVSGNQSLNDMATLLYNSTDVAYLRSLIELNRLPLQPGNVPLGTTTLHYLDSATIVAPRQAA